MDLLKQIVPEICAQKSDCVDPADPATKDQDCIKYRDQQMGASGVCVEPSLDPGNTVAPPGGGMNDGMVIVY